MSNNFIQQHAHAPKAKIWGLTQLLIQRDSFELHALKIKAGGYCSKHRHRKWNLFYVVSGELIVKYFDDQLHINSEHRLEAGDSLRVEPGRWHRFEAIVDSEVVEAYWLDPIDPDDIERADQGGIGMPATD